MGQIKNIKLHIVTDIKHINNSQTNKQINKQTMSGACRKAALNKQFLQVIKDWPVEPTRAGRDFGEHLKTTVAKQFEQGKIEEKEAERMINSLTNLSNNYYKKKYALHHPEEALYNPDMSAEERREQLSTAQQVAANKQPLSFVGWVHKMFWVGRKEKQEE